MTRIKLCGLSRREHIEWANESDCDYLGFVFAPSRRQVSIEQAHILKSLVKPSIQVVGVFVDAPLDEVLAIARSGIIDMIQLHGNEDAHYLQALRKGCDKAIIKAVAAVNTKAVAQASTIACDYLLFDAQKAGSGVPFNWAVTKACTRPFFLAGGLNPLNLQQAIEETHPFAVDMSSGLELNGQKDRALMLQAVRIAHSL